MFIKINYKIVRYLYLFQKLKNLFSNFFIKKIKNKIHVFLVYVYKKKKHRFMINLSSQEISQWANPCETPCIMFVKRLT